MYKYYTPDIEEFCIGFEFEVCTSFPVETGDGDSKQWVNSRIELPTINSDFGINTEQDRVDSMLFDWDYFFKHYNKDIFRVKYLDKEDIESLGFKSENISLYKDRNNKFNSIYVKYGTSTDTRSYGLTLYSDNIVDSTYVRIDGAFSPGAVYGHLGSILFKGRIKNKSELKKLLKQLGINE